MVTRCIQQGASLGEFVAKLGDIGADGNLISSFSSFSFYYYYYSFLLLLFFSLLSLPLSLSLSISLYICISLLSIFVLKYFVSIFCPHARTYSIF